MKIKNISIYVLLAVVVGIIVGAIDALFGRVLLFITDFRTEHYKMLLPFLPIAGLLITYMYNKCSKESLKGMSLVLETTQEKREGIPKALIPLVMIGTWITHLFGGSAGREGVAVQIGATLSHNISKRLNLPNNGKVMAIVGMSAGFGGLFQTPLAALFFAIEVITVGVLEYEALLPAFVGAYVASTTSHLLGLEKFFVNVNDTILIDEKAIVKIIILGIAFGLAGKAFSFSLSKLKAFMGNKFKNPYVRIGVVSIPLAVLLFIVLGGRYCGLGTNIINNCFNDGAVYSYDFILKIVFTVITLSIGFQRWRSYAIVCHWCIFRLCFRWCTGT